MSPEGQDTLAVLSSGTSTPEEQDTPTIAPQGAGQPSTAPHTGSVGLGGAGAGGSSLFPFPSPCREAPLAGCVFLSPFDGWGRRVMMSCVVARLALCRA